MLAVQSVVQDLLAELHAKSGCERLSMTREALAEILCEVGAKSTTAATSEGELRTLFLNLRVEELALARACAAGNNSAWELFLTRYREKLYLSGSLEGWLRTVLAQEYVNRYRRTKRLVSLDEESEEGAQFRAPDLEEVSSGELEVTTLEVATDEALASLSVEDRVVLSSYYLDERTLAEIARMLGVHESTISRKIDKLAKSLRKQILAGMMRRGMARRQAEEALEVDVRDLQVDIRRSLTQEKPIRAFPKKREEAKDLAGPE